MMELDGVVTLDEYAPQTVQMEIGEPEQRLPFTEEFTCVVCKQDWGNAVFGRLLPCLHHICSDDCLDRSPTVNGSTKLVCMQCSATFEKHQVGIHCVNYTTKRYKNMGFPNGNGAPTSPQKKPKPDVMCTYCDDGHSTSYCTDCKEFLCAPCTEYHMKMKLTKTHSHCTVEEGLIIRENECTSSSESEVKCILHFEPYTIYCGGCDQELCYKCDRITHNGHDVRNLTECAEEFRSMLGSAIPDLIAYRSRTSEAILDLESKITNILGTERVKLLAAARTHFHKVQAIILQRELNLRTEIVKKTLYKAKELNVKRNCIRSIEKQAQQYLELIPKLLEYDDYQLFSKRRWLTKQYFRLRESSGVLLDKKSYKEYVEDEWFFHIGEDVLLESVNVLKALGSFIYTDGISSQIDFKTLRPINSVPAKPGTVESILEKHYRDTCTKKFEQDSQSSLRSTPNGVTVKKNYDSENDVIQTAVENEYIGFKINNQRGNHNSIDLEQNTGFLPGTTLASLLDEKVKDGSHPSVSDLLSKLITEKTANTDDGDGDGDSEYDAAAVVQIAQEEVPENPPSSHSESEEELNAADRKRTAEDEVKSPIPATTARNPTPTPAGPFQPLRKSSRFEVSPRPGLALMSERSRRIHSKDHSKGTDSSRATGHLTSKGKDRKNIPTRLSFTFSTKKQSMTKNHH